MNENLSKLLKQAYNHPESRLSDDIWCALQIEQKNHLKRKTLVYSFVGILSLSGFIFMSVYLKKEFSSSGFFEYTSLVFSDGNIISLYWKEYLLSLADSIPVASLVATLFLLFSMLLSIKKIINQYKNQLLLA